MNENGNFQELFIGKCSINKEQGEAEKLHAQKIIRFVLILNTI